MHTSIHRRAKFVYIISTILVFVGTLSFSAFKASDDAIRIKKNLYTRRDSIASKKAFMKVYLVLMSSVA